MKKQLLNLFALAIGLCYAPSLSSQTATAGTLTITFTQVAKSPGYSGTKNYLAAWIQNSSGQFIKTKLFYAQNEVDHLPTWAGASSNGSTTNCLSASCNKTDATTGATLANFSTRTTTWDGKNVNGSQNGTTVPDGVYTIKVEECWNHGTTGNTTASWTFTKGPNPDHQTPANSSFFTGVVLDWQPSGIGVEESSPVLQGVSVYPNPSVNGIFTVEHEKASNIRVMDMLGMEVKNTKVEQGTDNTNLDLSSLANGIYFIYVLDGEKSSKHKVIVNK